MFNKIMKTFEAYRDTNKEYISPQELADIEAQICYIRVLTQTFDTEYKNRYHNLLDLMVRVLPEEKATTDKKISREDFVRLWEECTEQMFNCSETPGRDAETETAVYGHDVTVHWHGLYCNCSDGAVASNNIIQGIKDVIDEDGGED